MFDRNCSISLAVAKGKMVAKTDEPVRRRVSIIFRLRIFSTPTCVQLRGCFVWVITSWAFPEPRGFPVYANRSCSLFLQLLFGPFPDAMQMVDCPTAMAGPDFVLPGHTVVAYHALVRSVFDLPVNPGGYILRSGRRRAVGRSEGSCFGSHVEDGGMRMLFRWRSPTQLSAESSPPPAAAAKVRNRKRICFVLMELMLLLVILLLVILLLMLV